MPRWENREGTPTEQRLKDLSEEMGIENLVNNDVLTSFPVLADLQELRFVLVVDSGTLYLCTKYNGSRQRLAFSSF